MTSPASSSTANYGSWTQYGWRVGPDNATGVRRPANLLQYGFGMPYAPLFTYKITPASISGVSDNICMGQLADAAKFLDLRTTALDNSVIPYYGAPFVPYGNLKTDLPTQKNGSLTAAIQFEYPSCVIVEMSGAPTAPYTVTVFGYDWYMQPMQENIIMPFNTNIQPGKKAFYGITGVYTPAPAADPTRTVKLSTTKIYGLPYAFQAKGCLVQYAPEAAVPTTITGGDFVPAVVTTPANTNSTTGDVRGTFTTANTPNGLLSFYVTYFVNGASEWQAMMNGISLGNNPSNIAWTPSNPIQEPTPGTNDLFGVPQFYKGGYSSI